VRIERKICGPGREHGQRCCHGVRARFDRDRDHPQRCHGIHATGGSRCGGLGRKGRQPSGQRLDTLGQLAVGHVPTAVADGDPLGESAADVEERQGKIPRGAQ
jgi:hypothetical protein